MSKSGRRGRQLEAYTPKIGQPIPGLRKTNDGRWRVHLPDGKRVRFTEPDEAKAIVKAKELLGRADPTVGLPVKSENMLPEQAYSKARNPVKKVVAIIKRGEPPRLESHIALVAYIDAVRRDLLERPLWLAEQTGLPELAGWRATSVPAKSMTIKAILDNYRHHGGASDKSKQEACKPMESLATHVNAKTLDDLSVEKLNAWKAHIEKTIPGPASRKAYYARVRAVVAFGLKSGMDGKQIRAFLDRAAVLWTAAALPTVKPTPISREHFHKLLEAAGDGPWRAWLLTGLNLCLHLGEVCGLLWEDLDLDAGTHVCIREKTKRKRIPRAATLWAETLVELRKLPHSGPYVFISTHGTRYNRSTRGNSFAKLRTAAGLPDELSFDWLRDGAFTAAIRGTQDERRAKVLAGHACGMSDSYVLRDPAFARPACEAVFAAYGPFPTVIQATAQ